MQEEIKKAHGFRGIEVAGQEYGLQPGLTPPTWIHDGPVYEIFTRVFSREGTLEQVTKKIPYLKDLGIKTVWLMPIHPIGSKDRKGKWGSPYAIKDHYAIDKQLGTGKDLIDLVQAVHAHDMHIIMDLVANHTARDHVWTIKNPKLFVRDRRGNFTQAVADWHDIIDLDYRHADTADYMMDVLTYWVKTFDIDGYRCDVAGMVPPDFWEEAISRLTEIKQDIFLLAEWESSQLHLKAFHAYYDWTLYLVLKEIYQGKRPVGDALKWVQQRQRLFPAQALPLRFGENHDFARTRRTFGETGFYPYVAFIFAMEGLPLLYAGQEIGLSSAPSLFERQLLEWENEDEYIFNFYKRLIHLRQTYPALSARDLQILDNDHPGEVLTFIKKAPDQEILVLLNFCDQDLQVRIEDLPRSSSAKYIDLISGRREYSGQDLRYVSLSAFEVMFLEGIRNWEFPIPNPSPPSKGNNMEEKYYRKGFGLKKEVAGSIEKDYHSSLVDYIKACAYQITSGRTTVMLAREFGFCYGVDRSVEYAYQTLEKFPDKRIYLTGEIIHNPFVNNKLLKAGIKFLSGPLHKDEKIEDIQPDDIVILPAFGISIPMLEDLKQRECVLVDTTCGSVLVVWKHVERFSKEGFTAVVHGKYYHEETIATASRAGDKYIIVRDMPETQKVCDYIRQGGNKTEFLSYFNKMVSPGFEPDKDLNRIGFANQTTMLAGESLKISAMLEEALIERYGQQNIDMHFRSFDTICSATQDRQDAIIAMLEKDPDLTIIIGGFNSSNSKSLTSIAQKYAPAYHIEEAANLIDTFHIKNLPAGQSESTISEGWLPDQTLKIAVTAGASTPDAKIGEVVERLFKLRGENMPWLKSD